MRSLAWNAAGDWISQLLSWISFVVVMRLLTPADFGITAMAGILMPYLYMMTALGIQRTVVALPELNEAQLAQLNTVNLLFGVGAFTLGLFLAKPIAVFFHTPRLAPVFMTTCLALIPYALHGVPAGVLAKQLRFRLLSLFGMVSAAVSAVATLTMALRGLGYWALVLGNLLGSFVMSASILTARPCRLAWPRMSEIGSVLKFSGRVLVSNAAWNSYQRLDNFTAGKMLGQAALGLYNAAWGLAFVPVEKIATLVLTVIPSYLAVVQKDPASLRRYLRVLSEAVALATFPATVGLALVAPELVPLAFSPKWLGMIAPLEVLCFYAGFRSVVALLSKVLTAVGEVRYVMWNDMAALVILPIAFYLGSYRGVAGIAWGWVIAYPVVAIPLFRKTFRTVDMKVGEYLRALRPALEGTVAMVIAVELVKSGLAPVRSLLERLIVEVFVGAGIYLGVMWLRHRQRLAIFFQTAKRAWSRKMQPQSGGSQAGSNTPRTATAN